MRYQPNQLPALAHELQMRANLEGNVGRNIRRFLQQVMPGNILEIELSGIVPPELLREAPLVYPRLYTLAAAFVFNRTSDPELASVCLDLLAHHPEDSAEPSVLALRVKMPGTGTEDLGLRDLAEFMAVVLRVVLLCQDFLGRTTLQLPSLRFFDPDRPDGDLQALAVQAALAARQTRRLPEGMTADALPLGLLFEVYAAYSMEAIVDKALDITAI